MQRRAALGAGLGKNQRAVGKVERRQSLAPRQLCLRRAPVQPASNHQVKDQPKIILYADCDALAYVSQFANDATFHSREGRLRGSQEEGALQAYTLEGLTDYSWFKCGDVGSDVGQFWHSGGLGYLWDSLWFESVAPIWLR